MQANTARARLQRTSARVTAARSPTPRAGRARSEPASNNFSHICPLSPLAESSASMRRVCVLAATALVVHATLEDVPTTPAVSSDNPAKDMGAVSAARPPMPRLRRATRLQARRRAVLGGRWLQLGWQERRETGGLQGGGTASRRLQAASEARRRIEGARDSRAQSFAQRKKGLSPPIISIQYRSSTRTRRQHRSGRARPRSALSLSLSLSLAPGARRRTKGLGEASSW